MKIKTKLLPIGLATIHCLNFHPAAHAQGTAFTYQGRLRDGVNPANGHYDFQFGLFNQSQLGNPVAPFLTNVNVVVTDGLFTTTIDFGGIFSGTNYWLGISVRTNGNGPFSDLGPRQAVTPTPYAISAANLSSVLENNLIRSGSSSPTIGGGSNNVIQAGANFATIAGGQGNTNSGPWATIGGGKFNSCSGFYATVVGGFANSASGDYATIAGGYLNTALGPDTFAGGTLAHADNDGSFVWADDNSFTFSSTTPNQFAVRATGGFRFVTGIDVSGNATAGVRVPAGGTAWATISDRNAKKNISAANSEDILKKLAVIPIQNWNYKWEADTNTPHIGPMAQDFKAAFYPGRDDKSISTLEFDGVELAAIQGLNRKLEAQSAELKAKDRELQQLKQSVAELTALVSHLAQKR